MKGARTFFMAGLAVGFLTLSLWARDDANLEKFLLDQKPGTFLVVELRSGAVVPGRLAAYDDYYDTLWLEPAGESGYFSRKAYRLSTINSARVAIPQKTPE